MGSSPVSPTIFIMFHGSDEVKKNIIYDCLIIGGGPAGLSAAIYAARACLKVIIIEKESTGGKLNKTLSIENYPGYLKLNGYELGENMFHQVKDLGVKSVWEDVVKLKKNKHVWKVYTKDKKSYKGKSILIATGMKERILNIPNIEEYYGNGVSYCAICDGNLYAGKNVIVVGGGNSAVEESMYLSEIVKKVELVHRRKEFRAEEMTVKKMKKIKNIKVNTPYVPIEVKVDNKKVIGLVVENVESKKRKLIKGDCVFFYVGLIPENYFLKNINIEQDEMGFIKVNENMETSVPGIFAAGDIVHKHLRQVVTAVSDGSMAAISIKHYLENLKK